VVKILARLGAWLAQKPYGLDRQFPTREPRGKVHFDGDRAVADLIRDLRPGQQPKAGELRRSNVLPMRRRV
jgi:hypothetical protein